jgi:uncharacterized protein (TIGR00369 family)
MTTVVASGLDRVRAIRDGRRGAPGIAGLIGFTLTTVDPGVVECELVARDDMTNPMGTVHGGIAATLLDTAMGCAVQTVLDTPAWTTTDLHIHYVRSVRPGETLRARGEVVHCGRRLITAEGRLVDSRGKLVAHGTTSCLVTDESTS